MAGQHLGIVHFVDMVPRQDQDVFRVVLLQKVQILIDGVGGALVPAALLVLLNIGGEHMDPAVGHVQVPGQAGAYVCVQLLGFVLGQYAHGVNARVDAVGKGEVDDAVFAPKGDGRFGHLTGQGLQPAALAAGQQHGNTFLFHVSITSMIDKSGETTITSRQVSGLLHGGEAGEWYVRSAFRQKTAYFLVPFPTAFFAGAFFFSSPAALGLRVGFFLAQRRMTPAMGGRST